MSILRSLPLFILAGFLVSCASSGDGGSKTTATAPMVRPSGYTENDLFRVGDYVEVKLRGVPAEDQADFQLRVDESGKISMPHIGAIPVAGLTSVQVKEKIETLYRLGKIYTNPDVTVVSQQYRYVSVTGEVRSPQRIYHSKDLTALGAIATCGGFTDYANRRRVKVLRGNEVIEFNATEALEDPSKDIPMLPDDKIQVDRSIF